jgi:hypothetical protein
LAFYFVPRSAEAGTLALLGFLLWAKSDKNLILIIFDSKKNVESNLHLMKKSMIRAKLRRHPGFDSGEARNKDLPSANL